MKRNNILLICMTIWLVNVTGAESHGRQLVPKSEDSYRSGKSTKGNQPTKKPKKKKSKQCNPEAATLFFPGINSAVSSRKGALDLAWAEASFVKLDDTFDEKKCDSILYEVLIAEGTRNFSGLVTFEEFDAQESVSIYQTDDLQISIQDLSVATYSALVIAKSGDSWISSNRDATSFVVSKTDPTLKENINLVKFNGKAYYKGDSSMSFKGKGAKKLKSGDWISGTDEVQEPYLVQLLSEAFDEKRKGGEKVWNVRNGTFVDVFQKLSFQASLDVTQDIARNDESASTINRRLESDISFVATENLPFKLNAEASFDFGSVDYTADVKFVLNYSVEIDVSLFDAVFEVKARLSSTFQHTVTAALAEGTLCSTEDQPITRRLWSGTEVIRVFLIGGVPVAIKLTPIVDAFLDASFELETVLEASITTANTYINEIGFSLQNGWTTNESQSSTNDVDVVLAGKATANLFAGVRFQLGILIYFAAFFQPFIQLGAFTEVEATINPLLDGLESPPFHFSKFDLGAKLVIGATGEFRIDIPFVDEEDLKFERELEFPESLLSLPRVGFDLVNFEKCAGENALKIEIKLNEAPYELPISNQIEAPYDFVDDFETNSWEISKSDRQAVLTLKRSVIDSDEFYRYPNPGTLFFRSHARIPVIAFPLLFQQNVNDIPGLPDLSNFDCCEDSDCDKKYGNQEDVEYFCENFLCEGGPTATPTKAPSRPPTPPPSRPPSDDEEDDDEEDDGGGDEAGAYGDPHLISFDGLWFSCQGAGDFVLTRSLDSDMEVQTRFKKKSLYVSLATAVVARSGGEGSPTVEITISENEGRSIHIFLNGQAVTMSTTSTGMIYSDDMVRITVTGSSYNILFRDNGLKVFNDLLLPSSFPHWTTRVRLPPAFRSERIVGLLGSNNDDPTDDWTDSTGNPVPIPANRGSSDAYDWCTTNWCIRDESASLFNYTDEFPFSYHSKCDEPFVGDVDINGASQDILDLCGLDLSCIIDGIELGIEGSQNALETQAQIMARRQQRRFQAVPSAFQAGTSVNVKMTVNITNSEDSDVWIVERFNVYSVETDTFQTGSTILVALTDTGLGVDDVAGDLIFSNVLALSSSIAGESFSFQAVPVIEGAEIFGHPLQLTSVNAVLSFSVQSGIGQNDTSAGVIKAQSIEGLFLLIDYSWPMTQQDLDTGTFFLGSGVGFSCGSSAFVNFTGDSTGLGGVESARVDLGGSFAVGAWSDSAIVDMNAGWYIDAGGAGPASLTVYTEQAIDGFLVYSEAVAFVIEPGRQSGCASSDVGRAEISVDASDQSVTINVIPKHNILVR